MAKRATPEQKAVIKAWKEGDEIPEGFRVVTKVTRGTPRRTIELAPSKVGRPPLPKKLGRPVGSKNMATIAKQEMTRQFEGLVGSELRNVVNVLIAKALEGDLQAAKLILDRVVPVQKASAGGDGAAPTKIEINISDVIPKTQEPAPEVVIEDANFTVVK